MIDSDTVPGGTNDSPVPRPFQTIVYGGLAIGILDGIAATVNAALRGVGPVRVFQYIAGAVFGPSAFEGGLSTVALGIVMHFGVALGVATAYYLLSRAVPAFVRHPIASGAAFGVAVFLAMSYLIVPLTLVRQGSFSWSGLIAGIIIHILFVGLPVALISRQFATRAR